MLPLPTPRTDPDVLFRCENSSLAEEEQKNPAKNSAEDVALAYEIDRVLWADSVFRARDYAHIDVQVLGGFAHLYGHISSMSSQHQAEKALQIIPGLHGVVSHLILDDRLLAEVATSLGFLEHMDNCKFFTGVSHGVVFISGKVSDVKVRLLAEKCASDNPNVRGVINSICIRGSKLILQDQPYLQPTIGGEIIFLNGISGIVRQVIIDPNNRRVIAMIAQGQFTDQLQDLQSLKNGKSLPPERLIVLSMDLVRYLTKVSGFLHINTNERNRYTDFDPVNFIAPQKSWVPPYPYCLNEVLFPVQHRDEDSQAIYGPHPFQFAKTSEAESLRKDFFANSNFGA